MNNIEKNLVVKANALVESRCKMPQNCQYLLGYIISLVNPLEDKRFKEVQLTIQDIANLLDVKTDGLYKEIDKMIDTLYKAPIEVKNLETEGYIKYNWFYICEVNRKKGYIRFLLHDELNPFLLDLKEEYTKYRLVNTRKFTCKYSTRIYEFTKRFQYQKSFILSLDDIRELFICDGYKDWKSINRRVIKPSIEDINTKTDVKVDYELIKTGRAVSHIKFTVRPNSKGMDSDGNVPLEGQLHIDAVVKENNNKSKDFRFACIRNINMKYIKDLIIEYGENRVIDAIKIFNESEEAKVTKFPLKYLRGILTNKIAAQNKNKNIPFKNHMQRDDEESIKSYEKAAENDLMERMNTKYTNE